MQQRSMFAKVIHGIVISFLVLNSVIQPILAASVIQGVSPLPAVEHQGRGSDDFPIQPLFTNNQQQINTSSQWALQWPEPLSPRDELRPTTAAPVLRASQYSPPTSRRQQQSGQNPFLGRSSDQEAGSSSLYPTDPLSALHPLALTDYQENGTLSGQDEGRQPHAATPHHLAKLPPISDVGSDATFQEKRQVDLLPVATLPLSRTIFLPVVLNNSALENSTITPDQGGILESADGAVTIQFAAGAVDAVAKGTYTAVPPKNVPPSLRFVGLAFDLAVEHIADGTAVNTFPNQVIEIGTVYNAEFDIEQTRYDVTPTAHITVKYTDADVATVTESRLRLYRQDPTSQSWVAVPSTVDISTNTLYATISQAGRYALLSWPTTNSIAAKAGNVPFTPVQTNTQTHVVLDPDHGGGDPNSGQVTYPPEFAASEETYNLQVTQMVRDRFQACGVQVDMTREGDTFVSLQMRADMINNLNPDASATLAFNIANSFMGDNSVTGSGPEAWVDFSKPNDVVFGGQINSRVSEFTGGLLPNTRGVKDANNWFGGSLYVPTHVTPLYAQAELAFMDNYNDRVIMDDPVGMGSIADGIFTAFLDQLGGQGVCVPGFELPEPLSEEDRERLRNLGYQTWMRYRGDPINTSTGNHIQQFADLDIPGIAGFDFILQRTYNSLDAREGLFGYAWSSILDMNLRLAADGSVDVRYPDGSGVYFTANGSNFIAGQDGVFDTLSRTGPDFVLATPDQTFYLFDGQGKLALMRDRFDNTITFERDADNKINRIIDSAGRIYELSYDGDYIATIQDLSGRTLSYNYDGNGDLVSVTNGNAGVQQFAYVDHNMTSLTDPVGIHYLENIYDAESRVIEQTDASGSQDFFNYDATDHTPFDDNLGHRTEDQFDDLFRVTQTTDSLGQVEIFSYDDDYNIIQYTDKRGNVWTYTYDDHGNLLTETDPLGFVTTYTYNQANDVTSVTDQGGPNNTPRTTTFAYDPAGNLIQITRPDNTVINATYDALGQLLTLTDGNGHITTYEYDAAGNLTNVTDANGDSTIYSYDAIGRMTDVTDANNHTAQFTYDGNDNITQITDPKGQTTTFSYDANDNLTQMVDRRGGTSHYQYDENLKLIAETDPEGHTTRYAYDAMYNRIRSTDPHGNETHYRYDAIYQLLEVEDALAGITHFTYDENGNVTAVTDPLNQTTHFSFDALNRLESLTDPLNGVISYTYDAVSRLISESNPRGAITGYEYDLLDRLTVVQDALGGIWLTSYDDAGNVTAITDPNGNTSLLHYDATNRLRERIDAGGHSTQFAYDGVGNTTQMVDALGRITRYAYDANDNLTTITDALGHQTTMAYDAEDNLTALTDANGHTTNFTYDLDGMLTQLTEAGGQTTRYVYDAAHNLTQLTNAKGNHWTYTYDTLNRRTSETDPLGHTTTFAYDALSRLTDLTDANDITTRYGYDALDRLVAVIQNAQDSSGQPMGPDTHVTTTYDYDLVGNLTTITDANGHTTTFSYDLLDRLTGEVNPLNHTWQYAYDPVGNLTQRIDAEGQLTTYNYNADHLLTAIAYPDGSSISFSYDAVHNQTSMSDSLGLTQNHYDDLNRLVSSINHLGQTVGYSYDPVGNRTGLTYPDGRTVTYQYDETNFVTQVSDPDGNIFAVTRDATHNIVHIQNPNQTKAEYDIDAAERLTAVRNLRDGGDVLATFDYTLDPVGNRIQTAAQYLKGKPTATTTTYEYDPLYRLTRSADSEGHFTDYSFDVVGNRLQLTTNYDPTIDRKIDLTTVHYSYNAANQLLTTLQDVQPRSNQAKREPQISRALQAFVHEVTAQQGKHIEAATATALLDQANALLTGLDSNPAPNETAVATALDNLQTDVETAQAEGRIDNAGVANSLLVKLNRADQANTKTGGELVTGLYEYDRNGNRIQLTASVLKTGNTNDWLKTEYTYDYENRLTQVQFFRNPGNGNWLPGDETQLTYDGHGRLFRRLHDQHIGGGGQKWVDYVYDGLDPIAEYVEPSPQYVNYYRGLGRILSSHDFKSQQSPSGTAQYFHHDGLGSVSMLTKHQGQSAHDYRYHDYGTVLDNNGHAADASNFTDPHNHYTYTGQEWDEHTGLLHFYAREYDPKVGVWLQQDPYRGRLMEPETLHRYGYVGGNPVVFIDRHGYIAWVPIIIGVVVVTSYVVDYGWTFYDFYQDTKTIADPNASDIDRAAASFSAAASITSEIAEPDEALPVNLPFDDIARRRATKEFRESLQKEALERSIKQGIARYTQRRQKFSRVSKHLDHRHLDAAARELKGEVVKLKPDGKTPFDHVTEVRDAQRGLRNLIEKLKKDLSDPNLVGEGRSNIENLLGEASNLLDYTEKYVP